MRQYLDLLADVLASDDFRGDRTGVGTRAVFGRQMRFDLSKGLPLLTTKAVNIDAVIYELLWFLRGDTNIDYLNAHGVHIWDEWAYKDGDLGPVYGSQWRAWAGDLVVDKASGVAYGVRREYFDQIINVVSGLVERPFSRRHVVSAWNPADLPDESMSPQENVANGKMALAPCHCLFQFYVSSAGALSCQLYCRSQDVFLGTPFNIASYALLTHMVAQQAGLSVGELVWIGGDVHLYSNHVEQARLQLTREPMALPTLALARAPSLFDYYRSDFNVFGYDPHPAIKAPIAV